MVSEWLVAGDATDTGQLTSTGNEQNCGTDVAGRVGSDRAEAEAGPGRGRTGLDGSGVTMCGRE